MLFKDLPAEFEKVKFRALPASDELPDEKSRVIGINENPHHSDVWNFMVQIRGEDETRFVSASPVCVKEIESFRLNFGTGVSWAAEIEKDDDGDLLVTIAFFRAKKKLVDFVDVAIDEEALDKIGSLVKRESQRSSGMSLDEAIVFLNKYFVYEQLDGTQLFFTSYGDDWKEEISASGEVTEVSLGEDGEEEVRQQNRNDSLPVHFKLVGNGYEAAVARKPVGEGREIFILSKIHKRKKGWHDLIRPVEGLLCFCDKTHAHWCSVAAIALENARAAGSDYLDTWKRFGEIEGNLRLAEARLFGVIDYSDPQQEKSEIEATTVKVSNKIKKVAEQQLQKGIGTLTLRLVDKEPAYLRNDTYDFAQYRDDLTKISASKDGANDFKVISYSSFSKQLTIETLRGLPKKGKLVLSLWGDAFQTIRRENARARLSQADCPNPNLALVLEDQAEIETHPRAKLLKLSDQVRRKVFSHTPTSAQEDAIEVALNTPDIALIQGPPGTGKTTVIAAYAP